jgi:hypothetical protein
MISEGRKGLGEAYLRGSGPGIAPGAAFPLCYPCDVQMLAFWHEPCKDVLALFSQGPRAEESGYE